jgi:hypothetical protein
MLGFIRRNLGWFISLTAVTAICIILLILLISRQNQYEAAQTVFELRNQELSLQIELQEKDNTELNSMVQQLTEKTSVLENKLYDYDFMTQGDVLILDRSLPEDLLDTVLAYYQSINDKDYETYQSLVMNDEMLMSEEIWNNYNARPNEGGGVKSIRSFASDAKNASDLSDPSFVGNIVLDINKGFPNEEYLYLRKENGKWRVWNTD